MTDAMSADDESMVTEITIQPDGRVYVFGMSRPVLEILGHLEPDNERIRVLLAGVDPARADAPVREVTDG
jgi:hypothetical protein